MFYVSDIITTPPQEFGTELQKKVYEAFASLGIPSLARNPGKFCIFATLKLD